MSKYYNEIYEGYLMKLNTLIMPLALFGFVASTLPMQQAQENMILIKQEATKSNPLILEETKAIKAILIQTTEEKPLTPEETKAIRIILAQKEADTKAREDAKNRPMEWKGLLVAVGATTLLFSPWIAAYYLGYTNSLPSF